MREVVDSIAHELKVFLLAPFRIEIDGRLLARPSGRRSARNLVQLLALTPGHRLGAEEIRERLWPDDPRSAGRLDEAIFFARRWLEPRLSARAPSRYVRREDGAVWLTAPTRLWVDSDEFERRAHEARHSEGTEPCLRALELYTHDLLAESYEPWVDERRRALRSLRRLTALELADRACRSSVEQVAIPPLSDLVAADPLDEEGWRRLMTLSARAGDFTGVRRLYDECRAALGANLDQEPHEVTRSLYERLLAGERASFPADAPTPGESAVGSTPSARAAPRLVLTPPSNPLTSFVGRSADLAAIDDLLERGRLVTLKGVAGVGKTRLAQQIALRTNEHAPGRVAWAPLGDLKEPEFLAATVGRALGMPGDGLDGGALDDALAGGRLLLILDTCEHLVDEVAALVYELLSACGGLRVLATSREALRIDGEAIWEVRTLPLPPASEVVSTSSIGEYEALSLFLARAALSVPGFRVRDTDVSEIVAVCRHLDGIPLAIELAAARLRSMTLTQIAARLEHGLRLLDAANRPSTPNARTLGAAFDWSYELLTEVEQTLLCRLSIFASTFSADAVESVCGSDAADRLPVFDLLTGLVDKSLVGFTQDRATGRYFLHETVRVYARERLDANGAADDIARRHADHFLSLAEQIEPSLWERCEAASFDRLLVEYENFRAALRWARERDAETCLRLSVALVNLWCMRGNYAEGQWWLETALGRGDRPAAVLRYKALLGAGNLARIRGDLATATAHYEAALPAARETGNPTFLAWAHFSQSMVALQRGDLVEAGRRLHASLPEARASGNDHIVASVLMSLGELARSDEDWTTMRSLNEEALALERRSGIEYGVSVAMWNLGIAAFESGNAAEAEAYFHGVLRIETALGSRFGMAYALDGFAATAARRGDLTRSVRLAGAAHALRAELGASPERLEAQFRDRYVTHLRTALGPSAFETGFAEGRALSLERAVEYAAETT